MMFKDLGGKLIGAFVALLAISAISHGSYVQVARHPPGTILTFAGSTCPTYTVAANGASLARAGTYANLFSAIGTTWGSADGSHFNVPGLSGRGLKGAGSPSDGNGGTTVSLGSYQQDTTAVNGLSVVVNSHATGITASGSAGSDFSTSQSNGSQCMATNGTNATLAVGVTITDPGHAHTVTVSGDSETRVKAYGVTYCIWY